MNGLFPIIIIAAVSAVLFFPGGAEMTLADHDNELYYDDDDGEYDDGSLYEPMPEKRPKLTPEFLFRHCCEIADMRGDVYPQACKYPPPLGGLKDWQMKHIKAFFITYISCYAGWHDNRPCCANASVSAECQDLCNGKHAPRHYDDGRYGKCEAVKEAISECNRHGWRLRGVVVGVDEESRDDGTGAEGQEHQDDHVEEDDKRDGEEDEEDGDEEDGDEEDSTTDGGVDD